MRSRPAIRLYRSRDDRAGLLSTRRLERQAVIAERKGVVEWGDVRRRQGARSAVARRSILDGSTGAEARPRPRRPAQAAAPPCSRLARCARNASAASAGLLDGGAERGADAHQRLGGDGDGLAEAVDVPGVDTQRPGEGAQRLQLIRRDATRSSRRTDADRLAATGRQDEVQPRRGGHGAPRDGDRQRIVQPVGVRARRRRSRRRSAGPASGTRAGRRSVRASSSVMAPRNQVWPPRSRRATTT